MKFNHVILLSFLVLALESIAQTPPTPLQMGRKADMLTEMDRGVSFMEMGEYEKAHERFNFVLENMEVIPANLAFYVGKNSLYQKKYKQSIDWLNKYIQLKGTKGQYYFESVKLLKEAEEAFNATRTSQTTPVVRIDSLLNSNAIDCGPSGLVVCPVCKGRSVIIERGKLGDIYRPCQYSDDSGYLTCQEYNLLLQGKLKPKF